MKRLCLDRRSFAGHFSLLLVLAVILIGVFALPSVAEVIFEDRFEVPPPPPPIHLNDTGITWSGSYPGGFGDGNSKSCERWSHPAGQDCHYGRDAQAAIGGLVKIGGSTPNNGIKNGFDYTRICNSGDAAGEGNCPLNPALGSGPDDWACTRDNVTSLMWEVKVDDPDHLRYKHHTYSWYNANSPDGNPGVENGGICMSNERCDTEKFAADVNAQSLCGVNEWRMPTLKELRSILDNGRYYPAIDTEYFPNTPSSVVLSGSPLAGETHSAWAVFFDYGIDIFSFRATGREVRLVYGGS